ncbi:MAG: bifunctional phosphoglucose/phosphomannose isomerase [Euryarchaeota archaeon RBG_19FT_COMBO_56_21]|nr:MAG: bifunctional phosphoglucose/phosphomannose isomerase [Euryarchaeota archaeon RBG_19FT_COMBO_56_21]
MLDSNAKVKPLDKKDMLGAIEKLPEHLSDGLRRGRMAGLPKFVPKDIVVCGMGGSAIGGHLLKEWLATESEVPCIVCSSYSLPASVSKHSLVMVASYSGNTEESLSMFEEARKRRAKIISISSGGRLAKMSESVDVPCAKIPSGMVPRATLGYMFGAMLGILERSQVVSVDKQLEESAKMMNRTASYCRQSVPTPDNPAKMLAHELFSCVPVIIGHDISRPVAKRWANQLNENAKVLAHSSELPEMDHNEIVGWMKDARSKNFAPVFLEHDTLNRAMKKRIAATKDMLGRVTHVYSVSALGLSSMAKMFSLIMIGDYMSVYLAFLRHEDPSSTEPIDELKGMLSKK